MKKNTFFLEILDRHFPSPTSGTCAYVPFVPSRTCLMAHTVKLTRGRSLTLALSLSSSEFMSWILATKISPTPIVVDEGLVDIPKDAVSLETRSEKRSSNDLASASDSSRPHVWVLRELREGDRNGDNALMTVSRVSLGSPNKGTQIITSNKLVTVKVS